MEQYPSPKVSIVILNYNGKRFNADCLYSVLSQTYGDFEIIFIDNASTDDSLEEVESVFPKEIATGRIRIIRNAENLGFAEGNDVGVAASRSTDYIWLLNNDTVADRDALRFLVESIEQDPQVGATGSMILDLGHEDTFRNVIFQENRKWISTYFGELAFVNQTQQEITTGELDTSMLSGCSLLYRKSLFDRPFPDFYFAYAEDNFFSHMVICRGMTLKYVTKSIISHFGSGSKGQNEKLKDFASFHGTKNQIINFLVFWDFKTRVKLFPLFLITQIGHIVFSLQIRKILHKFQAWKWILQHYGSIIELRRLVRESKTIPEDEILARYSYKLIEEDHFFVNPRYKPIIKAMNALFKLYTKLIGLRSTS